MIVDKLPAVTKCMLAHEGALNHKIIIEHTHLEGLIGAGLASSFEWLRAIGPTGMCVLNEARSVVDWG